jgi:hypothetical protein
MARSSELQMRKPLVRSMHDGRQLNLKSPRLSIRNISRRREQFNLQTRSMDVSSQKRPRDKGTNWGSINIFT